MKQNSSFKKIGIISGAHGIRGELYVIIFSGDIGWVNSVEEIILINPTKNAIQKKEIILKLKSHKPFKKGFLAAFHDIKTRNQAEELVKFEVYMDENLFISKDGEQPYLSELINFEVEDHVLGSIGIVTQFSSNGMQDLLVLDKKVNNQFIEIPFIKEFVINVDYDLRKIMMNLPEGLVQINDKD